MLDTASNPTAIRSGWQGEPLPSAADHDARTAPIAPTEAWAAQPALALFRVPEAGDQATLMEEAFTTTRFPNQPTRKTLTDTFAFLAATGHLSAHQAQWLADNKAYPNRLWLALSSLTPKAAEDHQGVIERSALTGILQSLPLRAIARFVIGWHHHLPHCVPDTLITLLHTLCCQTDTATIAQWQQATALIRTLLKNVAQELNKRFAHIEDTDAPELPIAIEFVEHMTHETALMIGGDHMEGIDLNLNPDDLNPHYWEATKIALTLIQKHLVPIDLPIDILLMQSPMLDEVDDDLKKIQDYLEANDLTDADEHINEAIETLLNEHELYVIQDVEEWRRFSEQQQEHRRISDYWYTNPETTTLTRLNELTDSLPGAENEAEVVLERWLEEACDTLARHGATETWDKTLDNIAPHNEFYAVALSQYTPVFLDSEPSILQLLEDKHLYMMQGGDEDEALALPWDADPETLLNWCDKVNAGRTLITRLFVATYEATE